VIVDKLRLRRAIDDEYSVFTVEQKFVWNKCSSFSCSLSSRHLEIHTTRHRLDVKHKIGSA